MRFLKLGVISIIVFSVLILLLSLLIPSEVRISRAVNIAGAKDSIARSIADMRNWKQWNEMMANTDFKNPQYSKNAFISDELNVSITKATTDSVISSWNYKTSDPIHSGINLVQSLTDTTIVQWYFDFKLKWYPWEKFGSIIFDQQLGPGMEKSLVQLKTTLEASR